MKAINPTLTTNFKGVIAAAMLAAIATGGGQSALAQEQAGPAERATYVDLVTMGERSSHVIRAEIRRQTRVSAERSPGLAPGFARLYIEAETQALIAGTSAIGESLVYLVDVPLDAKGKPPKLKKEVVILFANPVPGRGRSERGQEIQLAGENAQFAYSPAFEARLRPVLASLVEPNLPPEIDGVKDALAVQGTLAGESETQIFLDTPDGSPVSLSILRRPGQQPAWGVSWGEIIDSASRPPEPQTLRWYRLACSLPAELPSSANLARDPDARRLAAQDYAYVVEQLGPCQRAITTAPPA